jgi:hypothetical protein
VRCASSRRHNELLLRVSSRPLRGRLSRPVTAIAIRRAQQPDRRSSRRHEKAGEWEQDNSRRSLSVAPLPVMQRETRGDGAHFSPFSPSLSLFLSLFCRSSLRQVLSPPHGAVTLLRNAIANYNICCRLVRFTSFASPLSDCTVRHLRRDPSASSRPSALARGPAATKAGGMQSRCSIHFSFFSSSTSSALYSFGSPQLPGSSALAFFLSLLYFFCFFASLRFPFANP